MIYKILKYFYPNIQKNWKIEVLIYWFLWLSGGIIYYSYYCNFGFMKGLYMAVNIGYSIGWNHPKTPTDTETLLFSIGYEFLGSSAVAYALQIFAECILLDNREWYVKALKHEEHMKSMKSHNYFNKIQSWAILHSESLIPICLCLTWLLGGALVAHFYIQNWNPFECIYFAFSSLATGGQQPIPSDSINSYFLVVGLYSAVGTPLMAYTMGCIAALFISGPNIKVLEVISSGITKQDLYTMQKYGLENKDGKMDRAEYLILCMLRLGVVDPELVSAIIKRYEKLDTSGDGVLSYEELFQEPPIQNKESSFISNNIPCFSNKKKKQQKNNILTKNNLSIEIPTQEDYFDINERNIHDETSNSLKSDKEDNLHDINNIQLKNNNNNYIDLEIEIDKLENETSNTQKQNQFMENSMSNSNSNNSRNQKNKNHNNTDQNISIKSSQINSNLDDPSLIRIKGQKISARILQLQREREKQRSILVSSGILPTLPSPVSHTPLSPSLAKYMTPPQYKQNNSRSSTQTTNYLSQSFSKPTRTFQQQKPQQQLYQYPDDYYHYYRQSREQQQQQQSLSQSQQFNKSMTNYSFSQSSNTTPKQYKSSRKYPIIPSL